MPTYEYECEACGHGFEKFQSMTDKTLRKCPVCKKMKLQRLIGAGAGIIFKGSGFYETDYKRKGGSGASDGKSGSGDAKSSSGSNSGTSDKGTAKTTESKSAPAAAE